MCHLESWFSQGICPVVELLDHVAALFLVFKGISIVFTIVAVPIYIPIDSAVGLLFLYTLFSSVTQSCLILCNPMDCSTPGPCVYHQRPEFTQTHVHWVSDAIQPSHPLLSPSPPAFSLSQHQGLFQWVSSSHQVAKVLEFQLQHQSFQWIFRTGFF